MIKKNTSAIPANNKLSCPACPIKLTFNSWREIANLSGISRIYGGIHGNNANYSGLIIGELIANDIINRIINKKTKNKKNISIKNNKIKNNKIIKIKKI